MESFAKWWPADVHIIGKNITRFPLPVLARDADERRPADLPRQVFAHGFMLDKGAKMSKTQGNVLDPDQMSVADGRRRRPLCRSARGSLRP